MVKYTTAQGRNLKFSVSDNNRNKRLGAICVEGCKFKIYASWDSRRETFVVKSINNNHNCQRNMMANRQLKSPWIADQFL